MLFRSTLPTYEETGGPRSGKTVALFYWSWHVRQDTGEPFNLQNFMEIHPEIKNNYNSSLWPTDPTVYFWNESVYGYYKTNDDWVLRKHAELLADAGVDVIIFDNTNGTFTWKESYDHIFKTFEKALEDGVNVPKITFLLPFWNKSDTDTQVRAIYKDVFYREKYQKLWFYFDGKPMLMCDQSFIDNSDLLGKEIRNYFTFRKPQPEYLTDSKTIYNQWGWLSVYPQTQYKASGKSGVEQITVGVAANHNYKTHKLTAMNGENVTGRTYTSKGIDTRPDAVKYGAHFAEQFEYALAVDPDVIFITGWNEWIVGRYDTWQGVANAFPDEYNDEFSRDIEPTKGKLRDNYYYQMVSYIRKFKGCEQTSVYEVNKRINLNKPLSPQWDKITSSYIAYENNVSDRRSEGYGSKYYKDTSGRNDIVEAKAVVDTDNIYFFVRCKDEITPYSDKNWMTLYIDTDENNKGWETFDYVIGKKTADKDQAYVQKFTGKGYETQIVAKADYAQDGEYLVYAVSKADIGLDKDRDKVMFKWTDNVSDEDGSGVFKGEILDFYRSGDVAPGGRFKYVYSYMTAEPEPEETTDTETETQTEPEDTADTEKTTDTEKVTDTEETADITDITETEIPTDPEETKEPPAVLRGDCNRDGEVDNKDVVALFRYVSGNDKEKDETVYDFNEDDKVDNKDVVALFRHLSAAQ